MDTKDKFIEELLKKIALLEEFIARQAEEIRELRRRLDKNSSNSSKPPSSDGLKKLPKHTQSLRLQGQKKSGGQKGHNGKTLKQVSKPEQIEYHPLSKCSVCNSSLAEVKVDSVIRRQVLDIPPPRIQVIEHQAEVKFCLTCRKRQFALFPAGIHAPTQYGQNLKSWAIYLQHQQLIPEDRLQVLFEDLIGVHLSTATLMNWNKEAYNNLSLFESTVLESIKAAPSKHLDETGFRVSASTQWLHVASTEKLTYYHVSPKRKSLLEGLKETVVHDHWRPYYQLPDVKHALCNQHHLRELKSLIENDKERWARWMTAFLKLALRIRHHYGSEPISRNKLAKLCHLYRKIIHKGLSYHRALPAYSSHSGRGRKARRPGHNLLLRMRCYRKDVLRFLFDAKVPFTNNLAERDLRMMKCKQKISGGFRSKKGAETFGRIRGYLSTARKQGWQLFQSIQSIFNPQTIPLLI